MACTFSEVRNLSVSPEETHDHTIMEELTELVLALAKLATALAVLLKVLVRRRKTK